jgi:hypothetical protein
MTEQGIARALVEHELLEQAQVDEVLIQQHRDRRPVAEIVADRFGIDEHDVYQALAEQIIAAAPEVNLVTEELQREALKQVAAREAWDYLLLPLRFEGEELVCATTAETLPSALSLAQAELKVPFRFVLSSVRPLEQFIAERYEFEGVEIGE